MLGSLDGLPLELLHNIFERVDFLTLHNVACTSMRGRFLVESLPAYRDLTAHAVGTIAALRHTDTIALHSTLKVYEALINTRCFACDDYAPFLYMLTCERVCLNCLENERSIRVMPVSKAQLCFCLTARDMRTIPKLWSVPGTYGSPDNKHEKRLLLVSAKQARAAAVLKYGDENAMECAIRGADSAREERYQEKCTSNSDWSTPRSSNYWCDHCITTPQSKFFSPSSRHLLIRLR